MEAVTRLGSIRVARAQSILDARNKVRRVTASLTDDITATRLATATSEVCRALHRQGGAPLLTIEIEHTDKRSALSLSFENEQPLPTISMLERFFDEVVVAPPDNGTHRVKGTKYLPAHSLQPSRDQFASLRAIVEQKSRDELMSEVQDKNRELEHHREHLEETVRERTSQLSDALGLISDSIDYASRIQRAILPPERLMTDAFAEHFVIWEPRDVVGGDIFWCRHWRDGLLVIVADCTGHGVPGAFMTLIANDALDNAQAELDDTDPGQLIQRMHWWIRRKLSRDEKGHSESNDGLELGVCYLAGDDGRRLMFSGARTSLFRVVDGEVTEIRGGKFGIGYADEAERLTTRTEVIDAPPGAAFYMASDGLFDQVGGPKRRGFGKRRFRELLMTMLDLPMAEQSPRIVEALSSYQGTEQRRDDVTVLGFRNFRG